MKSSCCWGTTPLIYKSHLLIALGTAAAERGYRVRYTLATRLVNELIEAADDNQLTKTINRYGGVDLLLLDELGYMELDRRGAELLFQVLIEREEKNAIAIASNESFSTWLDQDLHRPASLRGSRRPPHLRRHPPSSTWAIRLPLTLRYCSCPWGFAPTMTCLLLGCWSDAGAASGVRTMMGS